MHISDKCLKNFEFCVQLEEVKKKLNVKHIKLSSILPKSEIQRALKLVLVNARN